MRIFSYFYNLKRTTRRIENPLRSILQWNHLRYNKSLFFFKLLGLSTVAILTLKLAHQESYAKSNSVFDEKLISVIMITRHGARTPLKIVSKLDEVIKF